jgi:hypothetical protein
MQCLQSIYLLECSFYKTKSSALIKLSLTIEYLKSFSYYFLLNLLFKIVNTSMKQINESFILK